MNIRQRARELKTRVAALFLALKRPDTPWPAKVVAGITVAYALSPIDLIPDFIPLLGYLDDVLLLPGLILLSIRLIPPKIMTQCEQQARDMWKGGRPKKWVYALPIAAIWLLVLGFLCSKILRR